MDNIIGAISSIPGITPAAGGSSPATTTSVEGFGDALARLVTSTEQSGDAANQAVGNMLDGSGDVHDAMIALQRAELSLQLTVQVRNKLVQAYQDIMRMPV
jgi:flagellar hook-basal body complex protein FliE